MIADRAVAGPQTKAQLAEELGVPRTTLSASLRALSAAGGIVAAGALLALVAGGLVVVRRRKLA